MGDSKISELPNRNSIDGSELLAIVQGGVTKKMELSDLATLLTSGGLTLWNSLIQYGSGDSVVFNDLIYVANTIPTIGANPGGNSDWNLLYISAIAYTGAGSWSGIFRAATMNYLGEVFDDLYSPTGSLSAIYFKQDGSDPMLGDLDFNANDLLNIGDIYMQDGHIGISKDRLLKRSGGSTFVDFENDLFYDAAGTPTWFSSQRKFFDSLGKDSMNNDLRTLNVDNMGSVIVLDWSDITTLKTAVDFTHTGSAVGTVLKDRSNTNSYRITCTLGVLGTEIA